MTNFINKKLTPEQRDWLIEKIIAAAAKDLYPEGARHLIELLEKSTDVPFPEFSIGDQSLIYVNNFYQPDHVSVDTFGKAAALTYSEFKLFAESCNKIVEWINNQ